MRMVKVYENLIFYRSGKGTKAFSPLIKFCCVVQPRNIFHHTMYFQCDFPFVAIGTQTKFK